MRSTCLVALFAVAFGVVLPGVAAAQSKFFTFERNIDRPGGDYSNAPSQGAS